MPGAGRAPPPEPFSRCHKPQLGYVLQALSMADGYCSNRSSASALSSVPTPFRKRAGIRHPVACARFDAAGGKGIVPLKHIVEVAGVDDLCCDMII
jgi:hypothetical protein